MSPSSASGCVTISLQARAITALLPSTVSGTQATVRTLEMRALVRNCARSRTAPNRLLPGGISITSSASWPDRSASFCRRSATFCTRPKSPSSTVPDSVTAATGRATLGAGWAAATFGSAFFRPGAAFGSVGSCATAPPASTHQASAAAKNHRPRPCGSGIRRGASIRARGKNAGISRNPNERGTPPAHHQPGTKPSGRNNPPGPQPATAELYRDGLRRSKDRVSQTPRPPAAGSPGRNADTLPADHARIRRAGQNRTPKGTKTTKGNPPSEPRP